MKHDETLQNLYDIQGKYNNLKNFSIPINNHADIMNERNDLHKEELDKYIKDNSVLQNKYHSYENQVDSLSSQVNALTVDNNELCDIIEVYF